MNLSNKEITQLDITIKGDFPWAETKWEDVSGSARSASLSPTGKRAIMESRGEIFTVPIEHGNSRRIYTTTLSIFSILALTIESRQRLNKRPEFQLTITISTIDLIFFLTLFMNTHY